MRLIIKAAPSNQFMDQQFDPCAMIWIQDDKQQVNSQTYILKNDKWAKSQIHLDSPEDYPKYESSIWSWRKDQGCHPT